MKILQKIIIALILLLTLTSFVKAQLSGPLSGILPGDSTYTVVGNISVGAGDSLIIQAGATLIFNQGIEFDINGYLRANGNETDSIKFINSSGSTWEGIDFNDTSSDSSRLEYCLINGGYASGTDTSNGGGGILCFHSSPSIINCTVSGSFSEGFGGGIDCYYSNSTINGCTFSGNHALDCGGGIFCFESNILIDNCTISGNTADIWGGGIFCRRSNNLIIENCTITGNEACENGGGIHTYDSNCLIDNCIINGNEADGGSGIYCYYGTPSITNCTINENTVDWNGGGIYCLYSNPSITNCTISGNRAWDNCGGIYCVYSSPSITNCTVSENDADFLAGGISLLHSNAYINGCIISGNSANEGGGIAIYYYESSPLIENCTISGNYGGNGGGGISCVYSHPTINDCIISGNDSEWTGGGIHCWSANPSINNCTFSGNTSWCGGGGIYCWSSSPAITACTISGNRDRNTSGGGIRFDEGSNSNVTNCTISGNTATENGGGIYCLTSNPTILNTIVEGNFGNYGVYLDSSANTTITYSDFYDNQSGNFYNPPAGVGTIVAVNANGDSCDIHHNILLDPLFYATAGDSAFYLTENSPCIDAGDPTSPLDPDGTIADIGAFYYDQGIYSNIVLSNTNLNFGETAVGNSAQLELLISNSGNGPLELYSITSTDPVFTTNFAPDTLSPGDTISLTVTFTPTAVIVYTDTLTIISNDDPASVILSGEGILPVNIVLTPYGAPIVIPVGGGSFDFNILIENFTGSAQTTDMWTLIFAPNNAVVGPTLLINGLTLPPNFSGDRDRNQVVPAFAPAGTYTYRGYIGDYPWVVDDLSFFTFEKLGGAGDYLGSANDWICSGEPFDGEFISSALPEKYALHPAHPNPFNAVTTLCYDLPEAEIVSLVIYDVLGREVVRLCDSYQVAGEYNVSFDGSGLASGIYFAQLQAGGFNQVKKIVLMK